MSVRFSALSSVFSNIPWIAAVFAAGFISEYLSPGQTCLQDSIS